MCKGIAQRDAWIPKVDMEGFGREMKELGAELRAKEGKRDKDHLLGMKSVCDVLLVFGLATLWMSPYYMFPWVSLGLAITLRWCCLAHHVSHGGYHRVMPTSYHRGTWAFGGVFSRMRDWLDWVLPEAWDVEHNTLHHYSTNEIDDPDLVQRNFDPAREMNIPIWLKYALLPVGMATWKWVYYASNTWKHYLMETDRRQGKLLDKEHLDRAQHPVMVYHVLAGPIERNLLKPVTMFLRVYAPYIVIRLILPPLFMYYLFGAEGGSNAIINILLTELWANVHSFINIVPNHAGNDLYQYEGHVKQNTPSFYLRQVVGSANYWTGSDPKRNGLVNDLIDGSQGWLNYQIEHHCYPNLSMLSYRRAQPRVQAICKKYGVPYVQESIFTRLRKTGSLIVGTSDMRNFPAQYHRKEDMQDYMLQH
eukprot:TRINITY_DN4543_c1_g1_i1.p1 TRINITY_DN4543_c1_g1~~TRINITY_DN4543_c1_g1_i1.p1  ORF type:complete len:420 (+),score=72.51 TRINITY_DN4543_c1_g1_i1:52-1311(+)